MMGGVLSSTRLEVGGFRALKNTTDERRPTLATLPKCTIAVPLAVEPHNLRVCGAITYIP